MSNLGPNRGLRARPAFLAAVSALLLVGCGGTSSDARVADDSAPLTVTLGSAGAGAERIHAGDLAGARATYESDLSADPDKLSALNDLGATYLLQGHGEAARRLLDEVVAKGNPREQQAALLNLGELYAIEGYLDAAMAYLETARAIDRARPEPWYALALLSDARGELPGARLFVRTAVRLDEGGAARASFAYAYPEERAHLEALLAEQAGDRGTAAARWRELAQGRFAPLVAVAERHLAGE
jgi:tetratricopeptide (TPR) repeat protein